MISKARSSLSSATHLLLAVATLFVMAAPVEAQVTSLLVGNSTSFNALDYYAFPSGGYQGAFAGPGTGPPGTARFTYGPDQNVYLLRSVPGAPVLKYDGHTGNFIGTFVSAAGGDFTFGPDGNFYQMSSTQNSVLRYNGVSGQLIGTFVSTNITNGGGRIQFGPNNDLFVTDAPTIKRFNGVTGAYIGDFIPPGAGGLGTARDFLFTGGKFLVTGNGTNDTVLQFDGTTGAFLGTFAQGNGLSSPFGMTIGPDGALYVSSILGDSIKRFNAATGTFLGDFVSVTAHESPTYMQFAPFPIPEPSSLVLAGLAGIFFARRIRGPRVQKPTAQAGGVSC